MDWPKMFLLFVTLLIVNQAQAESGSEEWYTIEGKITPPEKRPSNEFFTSTQILVNGGEQIGSLRDDGSFYITGVPAGSHIVEVVHPNFNYESARVDITSKGKIRARRVNHIQPSQVTHVPYPLRLAALAPYRYFQVY
jgi:hypothetical protein